MTICALLLSFASVVGSAESPWKAAGREALRDFDRACRLDAGELWGVSLCGPVLLVDPETRGVLANTADADGHLVAVAGTFQGTLPDGVGVANTALEWAGTRWAMVLLPLPESPDTTRSLLVHEAWHRIQVDLGLPAQGMVAAHLERSDARLWLRLEWRALVAALERDSEARRAALFDALIFRARRHAMHPGAAAAESALELNEGLAEYTGLALGLGAEAVPAAIEALRQADGNEELARSFAYVSGPAFGLLLDRLEPGWRRQVDPETRLGSLAARAIGQSWPLENVTEVAESQAGGYGAAALRHEEEQLAAERSAMLVDMTRRLVEAPSLVLPLHEMTMQFDPRQIVVLENHGTVYRRISIQDVWGSVEVDGEALMAADFSSLSLSGKYRLEGGGIVADGWRLELAPGWRLDRPDAGPARVMPHDSADEAPTPERHSNGSRAAIVAPRGSGATPLRASKVSTDAKPSQGSEAGVRKSSL